MAMALLRLIKPGKGSAADAEETMKKARKENETFRFSMPSGKKAAYSLLDDTELPCLIIRPLKIKDPHKAVLYIYGGVSNNWKTQRSMAVNYAIAAGVEVWYPVYPSMTEVCITDTIRYLADIYQRMTEIFAAEKTTLCGVSMGGQYALQIINLINRERSELSIPGLVIAHSPGGIADNEADWDLLRAYEKRDPMFSEAEMRTLEVITPQNGEDIGWALYPAQGNFRNAPQAYLYYGEEMLAGNAPLYKRAFERSGSIEKLHIEIVKNMMHGYSCMPVFPESRKSYNETLDLIRRL